MDLTGVSCFPGDIYVHADLHGATSCVIKNPSGTRGSLGTGAGSAFPWEANQSSLGSCQAGLGQCRIYWIAVCWVFPR